MILRKQSNETAIVGKLHFDRNVFEESTLFTYVQHKYTQTGANSFRHRYVAYTFLLG